MRKAVGLGGWERGASLREYKYARASRNCSESSSNLKRNTGTSAKAVPASSLICDCVSRNDNKAWHSETIDSYV